MSTNIKRMRITLKKFRWDTKDNQNQKNSGGKKANKKKVGLSTR